MRTTSKPTTLALLIALAPGLALAQGSFIYPQKGQTAEQQKKDKAECHVWAVDQTGFDPTVPETPTTTTTTTQKGRDGTAVRGAAKGAALGAIGGAIAGDAGTGAAAGAAVGGTASVMRKRGKERDAQQEQAQEQQQAQASRSQQHAEYTRATGACLEGRGYTVK